MPVRQHWIQRDDLRNTKWVERDISLENGQIRLSVDAFALTANNVTYAAFGGPPMHYWNFFPAEDPAYGRVPVWGFGTVTASKSDQVRPGQRVYGYFPISESLIVTPTRVTANSFMDAAPHRQDLAPIYNTYVFTETDPVYQSDYEAEQMLFRPLYLTGWMICDCLAEGSPVPDSVVLSSASSKTALATAHGLHRRGITTIGLTSSRNREFVEKSGLYTKTFTYDEIEKIPTDGKMAFVDFAGRPALTAAVHSHCGPALKRSLIIGATDWEADRQAPGNLEGPEPEFFFVPDYAAARAKELGAEELNRRTTTDILDFFPVSRNFVTAEEIVGQADIDKAWKDTVNADIAPNRGLICRFD